MMVASSAAKVRTMFITSLGSRSFRLDFEAVMLTSTPRAPARFTPSSSGQAMACSAAMRARSMPLALAEPILEVDVDEPGVIDDFGNPCHGVVQHIVGRFERVLLRDVLAEHLFELVVEDDDQRIDVRSERFEPALGRLHAL